MRSVIEEGHLRRAVITVYQTSSLYCAGVSDRYRAHCESGLPGNYAEASSGKAWRLLSYLGRSCDSTIQYTVGPAVEFRRLFWAAIRVSCHGNDLRPSSSRSAFRREY